MFLHKLACLLGFHLWDTYKDAYRWYVIRECGSCRAKERQVSEGNWIAYSLATRRERN